MTEQVIANLVRMVSDSTRAFNKRLEYAALLSTMPDCDDACVELLDTLPPDTAFGLAYREVLVTVGASVDALCVLLWETPAHRNAAIDRLGELAATSAIPDLIALLQPAPFDRELVLRTLDAIGSCYVTGTPAAPEAVAACVGHKDKSVRTVAASTLRRMGRNMGDDAASTCDVLVGLLRSPEPRVRFEVAELLPELATPDTYVPVMVRLMNEEPDELIRWIARYELSRLPDPVYQQAALSQAA